MSTSAGWDGVLDGIINEEECDKPNNEMGIAGNCGSSTIGITFLLSYLVISFLIVINMYIAVILENYSQVRSRWCLRPCMSKTNIDRQVIERAILTCCFSRRRRKMCRKV